MINILKLFEAWATRFKNNKFDRATLKLTWYYVLSTAVILLVSSIAVLGIFSPPETDAPFRPEPLERVELEHDDWSLYEVREHLALVILFVDILILLVVSAFAYVFARRTLAPIEDLYEQQVQFLGNVAHELRTPLSVMQAGADTTLRKERTTNEYRSFVLDVQSETTRLTRLTNQLLHLLRTDHLQTPVRTEEDLSAIITGVVRQFTPYAKAHRVELTNNSSSAVSVNTNRDSLIEVLQNLIKNAIDYNKPNGTVTVSLTHSHTVTTITIRDTGIGIPTEQQDAVFGRFIKSNQARTHTATSGSGLGLAIVKELVDTLDGTISLTSTLNIGTTVTLTLPTNS